MSPKTILLTVAFLALSGCWLFCSSSGRAELPPSAYEHFQASATEALIINIEEVALRRSVTKETKTTAVKLKATVKKVSRTASGLKVGDTITITYKVTEHLQPWVGPSQVTIPEKGDNCPAYLENDNTGVGLYHPSAGGYTFRTLH